VHGRSANAATVLATCAHAGVCPSPRVCDTSVMHVIDAVLLPARTLAAISRINASQIGGGASAAATLRVEQLAPLPAAAGLSGEVYAAGPYLGCMVRQADGSAERCTRRQILPVFLRACLHW
jgi:hypothetical protein